MKVYFRKPIVKTLMLKGQEGQSIKSIKKTGTNGLVDTYTVTLTDGTESTFTVTNGKEISSIDKTETSGLVDTYTINFNDGTTSTFTVTNGKGIKNVEKSSTNGLVDTYTITYNDETESTFNVTNGKDGAIINLDATLSITSTNAIQNKAVAKGINSIQSQIDTLKGFPKVINTEWEFNKDPIGISPFPIDLASTKAKVPVGVYAVTYDIFVPNDDTAVSFYFSIQLADSFGDGSMFAYYTAEHKLPIFSNSDFLPGTIASFTDIIELTQENYISIWARLMATTDDDPEARASIICGSYDMKTINPTIVRLG